MSTRSDSHESEPKHVTDTHAASPFHPTASGEPLNLLKLASNDTGGAQQGGIKLSPERTKQINEGKLKDSPTIILELPSPFPPAHRPDHNNEQAPKPHTPPPNQSGHDRR
jgi:hypothetical protein